MRVPTPSLLCLVLFGAGCDPAPPAPPACTSMVAVDAGAVGMPVIPLAIDGVERKLVFDTGWPGLAIFKDRLPDLAADEREPKERGVWGKVYRMAPLKPLSYTFAGRAAVHRWPERFPESMPVFEERGMDGIAGIGAIAYAGSTFTHGRDGRVCVAGPPCTSAPKLWMDVKVAGAQRSALVDSGVPWTRALDPSISAEQMEIPGIPEPVGLAVPQAVEGGPRAGAKVDGRVVEILIGWDVLGTHDWRWDVCEGRISFAP